MRPAHCQAPLALHRKVFSRLQVYGAKSPRMSFTYIEFRLWTVPGMFLRACFTRVLALPAALKRSRRFECFSIRKVSKCQTQSFATFLKWSKVELQEASWAQATYLNIFEIPKFSIQLPVGDDSSLTNSRWKLQRRIALSFILHWLDRINAANELHVFLAFFVLLGEGRIPV